MVLVLSPFKKFQNSPSYYTADNGADVAKRTLNSARSVGQPGGTPIFFPVDFKPDQLVIDFRVIPFFRAISDQNNLDQKPKIAIGLALMDRT